MKNSKIIVTLLFLGSMAFNIGIAGASILPEPQRLSEHVYAWIGPYEGPNKENHGFRMNMGFIIGNQAIVVVDTGYTPAMAREMIGYIRKHSSLPIKYAVNTNSQPHRFFGNSEFKKIGSEIISTPEEATRMEMNVNAFATGIEKSLELTKSSILLPELPTSRISETMTLDLGNNFLVNITPMGANHTPNSLLVSIPSDRIAFSGDILYSGRLLAIIPDSNVKNWIHVFDKLKSYGDFNFIPGHGKPAKLSEFVFPTYRYINTLYSFMSKAVENDISIDDAMAKLDQSAFSKLINYKILAGRNASWTYLHAEQRSFE